jgi:hypothetical protein
LGTPFQGIGALAGFEFDELGGDRQRLCSCEAVNDGALGFDAQARALLPLRRDKAASMEASAKGSQSALSGDRTTFPMSRLERSWWKSSN